MIQEKLRMPKVEICPNEGKRGPIYRKAKVINKAKKKKLHIREKNMVALRLHHKNHVFQKTVEQCLQSSTAMCDLGIYIQQVCSSSKGKR